MTSGYRRRDLSIDQQLVWTTAASNPQRRFDGAFRAETIERFLRSSDAEVIRAARPVTGPDGLDLAAVRPIRDEIKPRLHARLEEMDIITHA